MSSLQHSVAAQAPLTASSHETAIVLIATSCILLHLLLRYIPGTSIFIWTAPLGITVVIGGLPILIKLLRSILRRDFGADILAGLSIITSVILGEYLVASIIV